MDAGVHGANGTSALKRVALDHSTAQGRAPGLLRRTVVNIVKDRTDRPGTATNITALVRNRSCTLDMYCLFSFHRHSHTKSLLAFNASSIPIF